MYKNILVPVLFDDGHDTAAAFRAAQALADPDAKFTVLHVMESIPSYAAMQIPDDVLERSRKEVSEALASAAETLPGAEAKMVSGHAGRAIVNYASDNGIDCIVVASHRPGFENYLIGSTADRVVRHAPCAVHVIR